MKGKDCRRAIAPFGPLARLSVPRFRAPELTLLLPCSFSRLYRGISAPIMMEAPKRATKFAANDEWGKFYRKGELSWQVNVQQSLL